MQIEGPMAAGTPVAFEAESWVVKCHPGKCPHTLGWLGLHPNGTSRQNSHTVGEDSMVWKVHIMVSLRVSVCKRFLHVQRALTVIFWV